MHQTLPSPRRRQVRRQLIKGALATLAAPHLVHARAANGKVNLRALPDIGRALGRIAAGRPYLEKAII